MASSPAVRCNCRRREAHGYKTQQICGIHIGIKKIGQYAVVTRKLLHHSPVYGTAYLRLRVIVTALAVIAAEFPVSPSVPDLVSAFKTYRCDPFLFTTVSHDKILLFIVRTNINS